MEETGTVGSSKDSVSYIFGLRALLDVPVKEKLE